MTSLCAPKIASAQVVEANGDELVIRKAFPNGTVGADGYED
jgi:hypothetical protein